MADFLTTTRRLTLLPLQFAGTALCFGLFGLGSVVFALIVPPALAVGWRDPAARRRVARDVIRRSFALFVALITGLRLVRIRMTNSERILRPGTILAASHPSLIDVVALLSVVPQATTIVKASLLSNPFTRAPIQAAGYASNDGGPEVLDALARELEEGAIFVIFPEGTRTPSDLPEGTVPKLHRGVAQLALHTGRPVTPVRITASPRWLTKDRGWWHLPEKPMTLAFEALEPIDPAEHMNAAPGEEAPAAARGEPAAYNHSSRLAARALTEALGARLFDRTQPSRPN